VIYGVCPSCGSATVHSGEVRLGNGFVFLRGIRRRRVRTVDYLCVTCGYFEKHLAPGKALDKVAEKWPPVLPPADTPPAPYTS
jgi:predicted nucleic-acid-binding Zn-ribbon protein